MKNLMIKTLENVKNTTDLEDVRDFAASMIEECNGMENSKIQSINDLIKDDSNSKSKTGIVELDTKYLNGGIDEGCICVISGRPGSGMTTLSSVIAINNAKEDKGTLFVSLQMAKEQIAQSYYSQISQVEYGKILRNELTPDEYTRLLTAVDKEENKLHNYHIFSKDSLTISELINLLVTYKNKYGVEVVVLDYIQQVRLDNGQLPSNKEEYNMISHLINAVVKKLKLKAYIGAMANRSCEEREDKHPTISDLRCCGNLGEYASCVLTLYRDEIYNKDTHCPKIMDISVVKNRFGSTGIVRVVFDGKYQSIFNLLDENLYA